MCPEKSTDWLKDTYLAGEEAGEKEPACLSPLPMLFLCTTLDKEEKKKKRKVVPCAESGANSLQF